MEAKKIDVEKMSQKTGVSVKEIKEALGLPLNYVCTANTITEAKEVFNNPETPEAKISALEKWISLCTFSDEAKEACAQAPDNSDLKILANKKWDELSLLEIEEATDVSKFKQICFNSSQRILAVSKWIDLCLTTSEIKEVSNYYSNGNLPANSEEIGVRIFEKWETFTFQEIKKAASVEDFKLAFKNAYYNSKSAGIALEKWIELSKTVEEIEEAYGVCYNLSSGRTLAVNKWISLSLLKIKSFTTASEAEVMFNSSGRINSDEVKNSALKKWIELSASVSEIERACQAANTPDDRFEAKKKWNELLFIDLELSLNATEAKKVFDNAPRDSEAEIASLKKWNEFSFLEANSITNTLEAKSVFYEASNESEAKAIALKKWIELSNNLTDSQEVYQACRLAADKTAALKKVASFF